MIEIKISIDDLKLGQLIAEPVVVVADNGMDIIVCKKNTTVDEKIIALLKKHRVHQVTVFKPQPAPAKPSVKEVQQAPIVPEKPRYIPPSEVKPIFDEKIKKEAVEGIQSMFSFIEGSGEHMTTAYQAIKGFEKIVDQVVEVATSDSSSFLHIHDLKSHDEYTYHHSLSVTLLAISTGQAMGLDDDKLMKLGKCAMLHDAGKQFIPHEIINKKGKLTDEEFKIMKDHPVVGANSIKAKGIGDVELWGGVMLHHEKVNGRGYPHGLKKEQIPLFARIIAVADVYDAITSYRSYRKPMHPQMAYEIICSEIETSFDYDIVKAFTDRLIVFPIGCVVELTDKRMGVVIDNVEKLRPVLRLAEGDILDLSNIKNLTIGISRVVNPNEDPSA